MTDRTPFPWEHYYPEGVAWDAPIARSTLAAFLDGCAERFGADAAVRFRDTGLTYADLAARSRRLAAALIAAGIQPGDAVALFLPNTPWHPIAFFAAARIGARIVHLSPLDARRELAHKLHDSGAVILITTDLPMLLPTALALLDGGEIERLLVGEDATWGRPAGGTVGTAQDDAWQARATTLDALMAGADPVATRWPVVGVDDVALLQYTGGTTGLPKGAMLTHGNLTAAAGIFALWGSTLGDVRGAGIVTVLPLFHIYALTVVMMASFARGASLLLHARFDPELVLADIETRRAVSFPAVPTMWIAIGSRPDIEQRDLSSLRSLGSGGAPMPFEVQQRLERLTGHRLLGGWGMTETASAGSSIPAAAPRRQALIGVPLPRMEMDVVSLDDPARVLPVGETGQIRIRGPSVFVGYWNQPEETRCSFVDGWFLTGDIGAQHPDGCFTLTDRKKNMIISGGFNVYPAAVENAIYEHPDVEEVIVIGIPDAYRGQAGKAFVRLREGAIPLTIETLQAFLRRRLGRHEIPAAVELRDSLPRSPAGKLLARVLIDEERAKAAVPA